MRRAARGREHATAAIGHHDHRLDEIKGRESWSIQPARERDADSTIPLVLANNGPERFTWQWMAASRPTDRTMSIEPCRGREQISGPPVQSIPGARTRDTRRSSPPTSFGFGLINDY